MRSYEEIKKEIEQLDSNRSMLLTDAIERYEEMKTRTAKAEADYKKEIAKPNADVEKAAKLKAEQFAYSDRLDILKGIKESLDQENTIDKAKRDDLTAELKAVWEAEHSNYKFEFNSRMKQLQEEFKRFMDISNEIDYLLEIVNHTLNKEKNQYEHVTVNRRLVLAPTAFYKD